MGKDHPLIGKPAPRLTLPGIPKGEPFVLPVGEKPLAVFFFPQSGSMGCTIEACSFRDAIKENPVFTRHPDLTIVGVSADLTVKQQAFADKENLPYPIVSDMNGEARKAFKVGRAFFGAIPERATFFVDRQGIVKGVCTDNLNPYAHTKFVEKHLKEIVDAGP
ncbi:hypothetical protein TREMEDRAFT_65525 [Tremella mesenterica DSM 1558]|uniref:uncharacterized protein n=1 Tax=Tremella mesenterica (strain ATCC 24925 / CBS 8224 / DSM 1558 / NBRC 9311 / NRRL Y-6157 / RJB 2259-6 / UBC 559-6) TaxID=578456 RepID=UPI00032C2443|nr:uncharacterized protein TREMEDRAFT_65525 [Tremella mesenterica DSM 1558]EIW66254.1 hypothetical protein TREMEDRAFT_65525 [Tremella mesenterica DSM 1558]